MAIAHYIDRVRLRAEPEIPDDLGDAEADKLIRTAEALVERALGPYPIATSGPQEGRKITLEYAGEQRFELLQDVVAGLAARLHTSPELLGPRFESASGPDFSVSKPIGAVFGIELEALLDATGLVIRGARARP